MSRGMASYMRLFGGAASMALILATAANAVEAREPMAFDIAPQPLTGALNEFGVQSKRGVLFTTDLTRAKTTQGVTSDMEPDAALARLLEGTGLTFRRNGDTFLITQQEGGSGPQSAGAGGDVDALIVTAQKKEENIQDVPIAISAFSAKALDAQKIEGGFDLLKAVPNVTFSKNNFTSYNFSIRGIGTKAISATTDPGVAVAFNSSGLIQNRLFEQEYFDVERVEVLRGPQGTLYGRNATGGVINVISAKPNLSEFSGEIKGEVGNYHSKRLSAMVNLPIVEDVLGVRFAGALTQREGYGYNAANRTDVDGRDLWSGRVTVGFEPTESLRANLIWERFEEDDNRARTSKQLCHRDDGPDFVGDTMIEVASATDTARRRSVFTAGCKAGSLYDDAAFGTPNGLALPFVFAVGALPTIAFAVANDADGNRITIIDWEDPYGGMTQSRELRTISSLIDPIYRAKADILELNVEFDIGDSITLYSQTVYNEDDVYSTQDYNRFNTFPIFEDTSSWQIHPGVGLDYSRLAPGGIFCDPQLGCSSSMVAQDISQAKSKQYGQEFRLQSNFDGPVNFSIGANYTKFELTADYYVMNNLITILSLLPPLGFSADFRRCGIDVLGNYADIDMESPDAAACVYVDPNSLESINGEGHNYFRSKNPYKLESRALFGELYWQASDTLKLTAGLRYTDDRKTVTPVPTQALLSRSGYGGGYASRGYPAKPDVELEWGEVTGRLGFDWTPELEFTDHTMVYAFYSRGYKGGGMNPPSIGIMTLAECDQLLPAEYAAYCGVEGLPFIIPGLSLPAVNYLSEFEPEFVNAFEVGVKNTLLQGALILNATAFYYDYKDYQVSQIRDRTAVNENFDTKVWGLEFEALFRPTPDLTINANLGLLDTKIGKGEKSIDIMNRTAGNPGWIMAKPWFQLPSNCIAPIEAAEFYLNGDYDNRWFELCGGFNFLGDFDVTGDYDPPTDGPNGGAGFFTDLSGNDLPNAPHWTFNIGAQYGFDIFEGWRATVRGDYYRQGDSYHRVYNYLPYDRLKGWNNANLSVWLERPDDDLKIEVYVKNVFDETPITDAFLNSDDSGLTTNVFTLDPRLIGVSIRKGF